MPLDETPDHALSRVYSPPHSATAPPDVAKPPRFRPLWVLMVSLGVFAVTLASFYILPLPYIGTVGFGACAVIAFAGAGIAIRQGFGPALAQRKTSAIAVNILLAVVNLAMMALGAVAALLSTFSFARGRQLRRFGKTLLPRVRPGRSWAYTKVSVMAPSEVPSGVAVQWRENGRTEHASVAAFARLTLDLLALGAPPHLVSASHADALDEIRHAELCFSLARSIDGDAQDPGPFPEARRARTLPPGRAMGLAVLAVDSLIDGALNEGVSARIVAKLAKRSDVPAIRGVLKEIAADEGRHSAHGWDVVEWCLAEGGRPVACALLGAIRTLPHRLSSSLPAAAANGTWERWGIHGADLEQQEFAAARAALVLRVRELLRPAARAA
jgi:hypothetical protein